MVDEGYRNPRLAAIYDASDPDRSDLDTYVALVEELGGSRVLDVGCGTGTLALMLAERGYDVVGVDPAAASLAVARAKPGSDLVRWLDGDATSLPCTDRDIAVLTGNVAQAIVDPYDWEATLRGVRDALIPGGRLVFETRVPAARAWEQWTREATLTTIDIPGGDVVTSWLEVIAVDWPLITFQGTCGFASDGATLTSTSTLRFREREEIAADLSHAGYSMLDVRDAPDRPGLELVFIAQRADPRTDLRR
jgi:ubiquinone/menaquinone biosynthesis C-methylase UbiE